MSRRNLPERGDLVLGTITNIQSHGVYVKLDEYEDLTAYCHISELSSTWVRNIRNVVREGKKIVGRVLRIKDTQIDISIKRVPDSLRRSKIEDWKHYRTAITLLEMAAKQKKVDFDSSLGNFINDHNRKDNEQTNEHDSQYQKCVCHFISPLDIRLPAIKY